MDTLTETVEVADIYDVLSYNTVLTLLHSERPKLYAILAFLSAIGLKTRVLCRVGGGSSS